MKRSIRNYLSAIGQKGGRKSRRSLDSETARGMFQLREAKRAFREFYAQCFWSYDPSYPIKMVDIPWVAEQLMKHGGREAWRRSSWLDRKK